MNQRFFELRKLLYLIRVTNTRVGSMLIYYHKRKSLRDRSIIIITTRSKIEKNCVSLHRLLYGLFHGLFPLKDQARDVILLRRPVAPVNSYKVISRNNKPYRRHYFPGLCYCRQRRLNIKLTRETTPGMYACHTDSTVRSNFALTSVIIPLSA